MNNVKKKIAIIGGKLQGTEAAYLARKAGIYCILIDKNPLAPASKLCDEFGNFDILKKRPEMMELLSSVDMILPTMENDEVLAVLPEIASVCNVPLAFDYDAYAVTSSKIKSDELIHENGIPAPEYYPGCKGPYILKPSGESGSAGVIKLQTAEDVENYLNDVRNPDEWVTQEYLEGPSYSVEVIGTQGSYRTYAVTEIHMDRDYDCCKVTTPCNITEEQKQSIRDMAVKLAKLLDLDGIMDLEVIDHYGTMKVLEIDARIPSQTPMAVFNSTGVNLLDELMDIVCYGQFKPLGINRREVKHSSVEHFLIEETDVHALGEHIMGEAPLQTYLDFFGADEALSDYDDEKLVWRGTFINSAVNKILLERKRNNMLELLEQGRRK